MSLVPTGRSVDTITGKNHQMEDTTSGEKVIVKVSIDAIQDYGEDACLNKASQKHTRGLIEKDNSVSVKISDFP